MTPSSSKPPEPDPLQPALENAEAELRRRLHEACEAESEGVSTESAQEIRQLEDSLLAAAFAARQAIKVRRQMKLRQQDSARPIPTDVGDTAKKTESRSESATEPSDADEQSETADTSVREFTDATGRAWRAWPVIPRLSRASAKGRGFLGDFQHGWICFEGLDSTARRRLPRRQAGWANLTDDELQQLLAQAIDAPGRENRREEKR